MMPKLGTGKKLCHNQTLFLLVFIVFSLAMDSLVWIAFPKLQCATLP